MERPARALWSRRQEAVVGVLVNHHLRYCGCMSMLWSRALGPYTSCQPYGPHLRLC